jgi:YVTN family beta-propeller protein
MTLRGPAALALWGFVLAGCAPPAPSAAAVVSPPRLYVADAKDGSVSVLDSASGRVLDTPVPAGPSPAQVIASTVGAFLVPPVESPPPPPPHRSSRRRHRSESHPLPPRAHHSATVLRRELLDQCVVVHEGTAHWLGMALLQARAAFYVCEQEGDGAGGELGQGRCHGDA